MQNFEKKVPEELKDFEKDFLDLVNYIKFNKQVSKFQRKMKRDINNLLEDNKIVVFADKTRYIYKTNLKFYKKLVIDNITKSYKISKENLAEIINEESEKLIDREIYKKKKIPKYTESDAFITVKDHKKQFPLNIECRLLNPGKNHIGRISKKYQKTL